MKVIAWNVKHRAKEKKIPEKMVDGIVSLNPDVVILTEFVQGPSRDRFIKDLVNSGLVHVRISNYVPKENNILVASRFILNIGDIKAPGIAPSIPPNFYHIELPREDLHIFAIRIPDYSSFLKIKRDYWDWILEMASQQKEKNCLLCGDFNTSPEYTKAKCGDRIQKLIDLGWEKISPNDGKTYWNPKGYGVQIDHAFIKGSVSKIRSEYIKEKNGFCFIGRKGEELSDHTILSIEIEIKKAEQIV